jgi:zeaxanthin epoxidase
MKLSSTLILLFSPTWIGAFSPASPLAHPSKRSSSSISLSSSTEKNSNLDTYELLSLPARQGRPLQIAIAGGGVGGLTAALCMLQKGFDVTVYEKTASFARFGGPIQFASNALSVLQEIDPHLFQRIMNQFTFTGTRTCGIKDGLRAQNFQMTRDSLDYLWNSQAPADWFVKFPLRQCADLFGLPYTGVIDRPDLQDILIDECRKLKPDFIRNGNPVTRYGTMTGEFYGYTIS